VSQKLYRPALTSFYRGINKGCKCGVRVKWRGKSPPVRTCSLLGNCGNTCAGQTLPGARSNKGGFFNRSKSPASCSILNRPLGRSHEINGCHSLYRENRIRLIDPSLFSLFKSPKFTDKNYPTLMCMGFQVI